MNKSLSNLDIEKYLDNKTNILTYPELKKFNSIDEILEPYDNCVILYLTKKDYGHWCCFYKTNGMIEFFDSYGIEPDMELKEIDKNFRNNNGQKIPYLTELLLKSKKQISFNNHKLQKMSSNIATCGRHCIVRICNKDIPIDEYAKILKLLGNPDKVVTEITHNI